MTVVFDWKEWTVFENDDRKLEVQLYNDAAFVLNLS